MLWRREKLGIVLHLQKCRVKEKLVIRLAEHRSFGRVKLTDTLAGKDHIQRVFSSFCQDFAKITVFVDGEVLHLIYVDVAWRLSSLRCSAEFVKKK